MSILKDRIRPLDPSSLQEFIQPDRDAQAQRRRPEPPRAPGDDVRAALRAQGPRGKTSFELGSRGAYAHTVTVRSSGEVGAGRSIYRRSRRGDRI